MLTGEGRGFCSGQDLGDARALGVPDFERILREEYEPLLRAIAHCPLPTLAAVNGVAAGAGANLALACDVVIAAESAGFIQAFTRIGLIPDAGGTWTLPRQIGLARAMGATLFADRISAADAASWGMIYEAVPDEAFETRWQARAAHLAEGPTEAYRGLKQALRASFDNSFEEQLALEARLQGAMRRVRRLSRRRHGLPRKAPRHLLGALTQKPGALPRRASFPPARFRSRARAPQRRSAPSRAGPAAA